MLEGQKQKVHSLVDKVYARKNLQLAWERVRANQGASGTDKVTIEEFEANLDANLERLHRELRDDTYQPLPVRRLEIPKRGAPGKTRPLGIPSIYDRVCQQGLVNRLEPIFEKVFDASSFGYRKGRKTADALTKIWREIQAGSEWIVDADLKDYFGSVDHDKLLALVGKQIADGRVLKLIQQTLKAGYEDKGRWFETPLGTPQGGVVSPMLSNILLTPFDKEMRRHGYQLTRWADDWVVTCRTRARGAKRLGSSRKDTRKSRCDAQPGEDADCAHRARLRVSWIQNPTWERTVQAYPRPDQVHAEPTESLCHSHSEVSGPIQRSDQNLDPEVCASGNG